MTFSLLPEDALKLAIAVLLGGIVGVEREYHDKSAGFRTMIFICAGSTLFTLLSIKLGGPSDPARIAAQIVTGVGFLGAGAILREGGRLVGLTTAATIWVMAALGMAVGMGLFALAGVITLLILIVLWVFPVFEGWIDPLRDARTYYVVCDQSGDTLQKVEAVFAEHGLRVRSRTRSRVDQRVTCSWAVIGPRERLAAAAAKIFDLPDVQEFRQ